MASIAASFHDYLQVRYDQLLTAWPYSDRALWVLGTLCAHLVTWYVSNLVLYLVYHFNLFQRYKIQGSKWPERALVLECLRGNLITHFLLQPLSLTFIGYPVFNYFGSAKVNLPVPSFFTFFWQIPVMFIVNDALFYWAHRALHHPSIYKHVHKQHHRFKQPIGIAAEFAHPIEALLANEIPTIAGCLLLGAHPLVFWTYLALRMWETIDSHSGFKFPWSPWNLVPGAMGGAEFHDYHHSVNIGNYGMLRFWDWVMGTDLKYNQSKQNKIQEKRVNGENKAA